jgi:hypothetical protein
LLFIAVTVPVMFGLLGLTVDIGWAHWRKEAAYTAAEAAVSAVVLAAGVNTPTAQSSTPCPGTLSAGTPWQVGCLFAKQNGFTQGSNGQSVAIQIGSGSTGIPASGVSPDKYWVSATVSETIPALFSRVFGYANLTVAARATEAVYRGIPGACIYVLDNSAANAFRISGGLTTDKCGFYVDSTSSSAFNLTGGTVELGTTGSKVNLHTSSISPWPPTGGAVTCGGVDCHSTNVVFSQGAVLDPMSGMTAPTPAGVCIPDPNITAGTRTLNSGTYCALTIKGGTVTLNAGTYIMATGNFKVSGTDAGAPVNATSGVTIFFPSSNTTGVLSVTGGAGLNLNAPQDGGSTDGIAVWAAANPAPATNWTGSLVTINGVLYMPHTALNFTGGGTAVNETIICDTLTTTGGNVAGPATSKFLTGTGTGGTLGGAFLVQ